jgi:3-oxoacyl-(acyl-carrier-protein) synthase
LHGGRVPSWQTTVVVEPGGTTTVVLAGGWDGGTTTVVFSGGGGLLLLTQPESAIAASINAEIIFMITPQSSNEDAIDTERPARLAGWAGGVRAHRTIARHSVVRRLQLI